MKLLILALITLCSIRIGECVRIVLEENIADKCDYSKCPTEINDGHKLYVHLVPHTHDDVGWLKTVDQYYYGTKQSIQKASVQDILDTVIDELIRNKQRQFEFINGGWSMPDEATTHYQSLIDQSTWGLRRLNDTFGHCGRPTVTWQIDPFGHSRELASLYAQMGYDALYFAREDYQDRYYRQFNQTLEHVWQGSDDLGKRADIFTGMMQMGYGPPKGLNWDLVGGENDHIVDNIDSKEYNVPQIVKQFRQLAKEYSQYYATNHIMFPMGTDFNYQSAHQWFQNMDKLINAINSDPKFNDIQAIYSTPSCYTKALYDSNHTWPTKRDDYFPYASDPHAFWTGYYTSRPSLKRMERVGNNWLQVCKQLDSFALNNGQYDSNITRLREAMGILQHHDAVAGTEKQHVANDYARILHEAIVECQQIISLSLNNIAKSLGQQFHSKPDELQFCNDLNISSCSITESGHSFLVSIYNPLIHPLSNHTVRLPVNERFFYQVFDDKGQSIPAVLIPIPEWIREIPGRPQRPNSNVEIVFKINHLEALGLVTYTIRSSSQFTKRSARLIKGKPIESNGIKLFGRNFDLFFDENGKPRKIMSQYGSNEFRNAIRYYEGSIGDNQLQTNRSSGAYIFRPIEQTTNAYGEIVESIAYIDNDYGLVQEIHQKYEDNVFGQIIRLTGDSEFVEFDFVVGPISVWDNIGKEIVLQYQIDQDNEGRFKTDANGRQLLSRKWNYRPTWPVIIEEHIAGNYYPVDSRILLDNPDGPSIAVLTDRSEGGTSPYSGMIELMVHRRLLHDDGFGVDEALNEPGVDGHGLVIRGRHRLLLFKDGQPDSSYHRPLSQQFFMEPIMIFAKLNKQRHHHYHHTKSMAMIMNKFSMLRTSTSLPPQIHLLTLEQWSYDRLLLRLENIYQQGEPNSKKVRVNLRNLFTTFTITHVEEMTLSANQPINVIDKRLQFNYQSSDDNQFYYRPPSSTANNTSMDIELGPMEIRTFLIKISKPQRQL
ncbi:carbohydrate binding [Dermatophagoides pteronyssinus]|uniref:Alpha-mannosidase n=1 Tax=Dermatophagoides pteronyssinus TaxID=6956 RepID=A0ABQ8JQ44_DERPT|nr:carbohydrate binding [Dermatophagoides pteronyssinus]